MIKLKDTDFITSDLHIDDAGVAKRRWCKDDDGRGDADKWNRELVRRWQGHITDKDTVLILGDVFVGSRRHAFDILMELPGAKILVRGNWDKIEHQGRWRPEPWLRQNGGPFDEVYPGPERVEIDGVRFNASHYPYVDVAKLETQGAYPMDDGLPLLHGHTHSYLKFTQSKLGSIQLHVGLDAWRVPPTAGRLVELYRTIENTRGYL